MLSRVLEPEAMDTDDSVAAYDAMDHTAVNAAFVADALVLAPSPARALDLGTGTARIALALCAAHPTVRVTGVDLSPTMVRRGARNVAAAGLTARVGLVVADVTRLPYAPGDFDLVQSNSLVHHLPEPARFFAALVGLASAPGVAVFVRDLLRPESVAARDALVARHAASDSALGRELFRASLHASLSLDEVKALVTAAGLEGATVAQTSDRHWTLVRPAR
jgi:ubiquinone/menaquinone biosynthesis C-methylase UbiE